MINKGQAPASAGGMGLRMEAITAQQVGCRRRLAAYLIRNARRLIQE